MRTAVRRCGVPEEGPAQGRSYHVPAEEDQRPPVGHRHAHDAADPRQAVAQGLTLPAAHPHHGGCQAAGRRVSEPPKEAQPATQSAWRHDRTRDSPHVLLHALRMGKHSRRERREH